MTQRDADMQAFLRKIVEEPFEPLHRLVYADWLEENPTEYQFPEQSQIIDKHIRLLRESAEELRTGNLKQENMGNTMTWAGYYIGVVSSVSCTCEAIVDVYHDTFAYQPIIQVELIDVSSPEFVPVLVFKRVAKHDPRDRCFDVCGERITEAQLYFERPEQNMAFHRSSRRLTLFKMPSAELANRILVSYGRQLAGLTPIDWKTVNQPKETR